MGFLDRFRLAKATEGLWKRRPRLVANPEEWDKVRTLDMEAPRRQRRREIGGFQWISINFHPFFHPFSICFSWIFNEIWVKCELNFTDFKWFGWTSRVSARSTSASAAPRVWRNTRIWMRGPSWSERRLGESELQVSKKRGKEFNKAYK